MLHQLVWCYLSLLIWCYLSLLVRTHGRWKWTTLKWKQTQGVDSSLFYPEQQSWNEKSFLPLKCFQMHSWETLTLKMNGTANRNEPVILFCSQVFSYEVLNNSDTLKFMFLWIYKGLAYDIPRGLWADNLHTHNPLLYGWLVLTNVTWSPGLINS